MSRHHPRTGEGNCGHRFRGSAQWSKHESLDCCGVSFTRNTDGSPLDFLNDVPGADAYDELRSSARQVNATGVNVWVVGYEDLIRMKEASGREQELLDIHQLNALVNENEDS